MPEIHDIDRLALEVTGNGKCILNWSQILTGQSPCPPIESFSSRGQTQASPALHCPLSVSVVSVLSLSSTQPPLPLSLTTQTHTHVPIHTNKHSSHTRCGISSSLSLESHQSSSLLSSKLDTEDNAKLRTKQLSELKPDSQALKILPLSLEQSVPDRLSISSIRCPDMDSLVVNYRLQVTMEICLFMKETFSSDTELSASVRGGFYPSSQERQTFR